MFVSIRKLIHNFENRYLDLSIAVSKTLCSNLGHLCILYTVTLKMTCVMCSCTTSTMFSEPSLRRSHTASNSQITAKGVMSDLSGQVDCFWSNRQHCIGMSTTTKRFSGGGADNYVWFW